MSDEFFKIARQEIETELHELELIVTNCKNDEHVFKNSRKIEEHLHKIKGLAPMIDQEMVAEISKTADVVMRHIINQGALNGAYNFIKDAVVQMKNIFNDQKNADIDDFIKSVHEAFPQISSW